MDDYHAFTSTSTGGGGGTGCPAGCLPWMLGVLAILYLMGKVAG